MRRGIAVVGACLALEATSCPVTDFRDDRFALAACPAVSFALPFDMRDGPYHLARESRDFRPAAPGLDSTFVTYVFSDLTEHADVLGSVALRLVRGSSCSLDVLRAAAPHGKDSLRDGQAAAIARTVALSAGTRAIEPGRSERVRSRDLRAWARRTSSGSS